MTRKTRDLAITARWSSSDGSPKSFFVGPARIAEGTGHIKDFVSPIVLWRLLQHIALQLSTDANLRIFRFGLLAGAASLLDDDGLPCPSCD